MIIKNFKQLAQTRERSLALSIINFILKSLQPSIIIDKFLKLKKDQKITLNNKSYDLKEFENIYLIGIGKGSFLISLSIIKKIRFIKEGYIIDLFEKDIPKIKNIQIFKGSHPLPSNINFNFSTKIIDRFHKKVKEKDLIFVVVCGGGSAMLVYPAKINLKKYTEINSQLLKSGANIYEMNIVRKHLDLMKGGGLAKFLYPARIISLIFSDVPEDNLSFIASGPTVKDKTNINDALRIIKKYKIQKIKKDDLIETSKDNKYFKNVDNILVLNNFKILKEAKELTEKEFNLKVKILSYKLKGEVKKVAKYLLREIKKAKEDILLLGGETTVKVKGKGRGGRNQELVLYFLKYLQDYYSKELNNFLIISINSDGWDNTPFAGAIGDYLSLDKANRKKLNLEKFLNNNDSFNFFKKIKDGIITDRLPLNISDLILIFKKK